MLLKSSRKNYFGVLDSFREYGMIYRNISTGLFFFKFCLKPEAAANIIKADYLNINHSLLPYFVTYFRLTRVECYFDLSIIQYHCPRVSMKPLSQLNDKDGQIVNSFA